MKSSVGGEGDPEGCKGEGSPLSDVMVTVGPLTSGIAGFNAGSPSRSQREPACMITQARDSVCPSVKRGLSQRPLHTVLS